MSKQIRADIFLLLITAIWGASFPLMKNVLDYINSFAFLSLRFIIAAIILAVIFFKNFASINRKIVVCGFITGFMLFAGMVLQVTGLRFTTASNSAFITGLNVVLVPVISSTLLRKKPDINSTIGVTLAAAGLFFLSGGLDFSFNFGDFLTLLCAVAFAMQIIFIDKFTNEHSPVLLAVLQIGFVALLSSIVWAFTDYEPLKINTAVIVTLIVTGVLGTALAFAGQSVVQRFTSPTRTALIFSAEPVFGAIFAMTIPDANGSVEMLTWNAAVGCFFILAGMLISEIKLKKK